MITWKYSTSSWVRRKVCFPPHPSRVCFLSPSAAGLTHLIGIILQELKSMTNNILVILPFSSIVHLALPAPSLLQRVFALRVRSRCLSDLRG